MIESRLHQTTLAALARHFKWYEGHGRLIQTNSRQCETCYWLDYPRMRRFKIAPKYFYQTTLRRIRKIRNRLRSRMARSSEAEELYWKRLQHVGEARVHEVLNKLSQQDIAALDCIAM